MAYRVLEVTLLSAKDLKNVNLITRMEVYAVATISGDPITRQCTPPDPHGGRNPTWNATLRFSVPPTVDATTGGGCLHILLRVQRMFGTDRDVGEVIVPLTEILAGVGDHGGDDLSGPTLPQFASYQIHKVHRTETCGELYLTYRLGPVVGTQQKVPLWVTDDKLPVVAYPVPEKLMRPLTPPQVLWPGQVVAPPPTKPAGYVAVPLSTANPPGHVDVEVPSPKHPGYAAVPSSPKPVGHAAVPPSPKPSGQALSMPPSPKPVGRVVSMPPSTKPSGGQAVAMPPPPKQVERVVSMPPPQTPARHVVSTPPSPKSSGQAVSMPPSPKQVKRVVSMPPPQTPARPVVSMPPSPQPSGQEVSMPPSPKQVERAVSMPPPQTPARPVVSMPQSTNPVGRVVSMPPQKQAGQHVSMPPSPKPAGHVTLPSSTSHPSGHAMPPSPKPVSGHVSVPPSPTFYSGPMSMPPSPKPPVHEAVSPPPKSNGLVAANLPATANNSSNMEFGWGLGAGLVSGAISGMLAGGNSRSSRFFTGSRSVRP